MDKIRQLNQTGFKSETISLLFYRSTSLKEALDMMIMDFQKLTDVTILYLCHLPLVNLNADEEEIVYRVVQEGMTNSVRHGPAT